MIKNKESQTPAEECLLSALQERYTSIHNIRERVQSISLRLLGILLGVSGWIIQKNMFFDCNEKVVVIGLIMILAFIFYKYFEDLKLGVNKQREIAAKIEDKLGFFEGENPIYPKKRKEKSENRPFLNSHYLMLGFGFFVLVISILYFT